MMESKLRVLILDDVPEDAELIKYFLKKEDIAFISTVVGNKDEFILALSEFKPDLILPIFIAHFVRSRALDINSIERYPAMPFILLRSLNEEQLCGCIKAGDWITSEKQSLTRLVRSEERSIVLGRT
jgi:chemotaxis response regulator CheB